MQGKVDIERRAFVYLAFHINISLMFLDDLIGNGQPQPTPRVLCGEEGMKDRLKIFSGNPGACVCKLNLDVRDAV